MGWDDELTKLEQKLRVLEALLDQLKTVSERTVALPFSEWLLLEKHRSERYNHYFSLVVLESAKLSALAILCRINGSVRASDIVGLVDGEGRYHAADRFGDGRLRFRAPNRAQSGQMVGIILPETDRKGGEITTRRLSSVLADEEEVTIGIAVYPDDGTSPQELLKSAAG